MPSLAESSLRSFKRKLKSLTGNRFWVRYLTLAPYRALCAWTSALTGLTQSGARHAESSVEQAIQHICSVYQGYKAAAGVNRFHGKVAEIGPGDSCGIGLMFLADGCDHVDLVDRFFSARDEGHLSAINRAIVRQNPRLSTLMKDDRFSETSFNRLLRQYGENAAAETFFSTSRGYDFIVSCAVLEHVYDPLGALSAMAGALKPGGMMLHQVDCRDHGQFSEYFHDLKFLELPSWMYSPLKWGGGPNRIRLASYVNVLRQERLNFTIYVNSLTGIPEELPQRTLFRDIPEPALAVSRQTVATVRNHLARPFRSMADEELMVARFTIVATKDGPSQPK